MPLFAVGSILMVAGILSGLSWKIPQTYALDRSLYLKINTFRAGVALDWCFAALRWWGTKWALMAAIAAGLIWRWQSTWTLIPAALLTAAIERAVKLLVRRPRPFHDLPEAQLRQNPVPMDDSFPSGDATRTWFIFAVIFYGLDLAPSFSIVAALLALMVSFGRIRLGAHYPLDVWAGSCLGWGAGIVWATWLGW